MVNYANRGKQFEKLIEHTNNVYKQKGIAVIDKIPTPVNFNPRTKKAFYEGKSTVDFIGCNYKGRMIAFDAKKVSGKSFPFKNIANHQVEYLKDVKRLGASAFFLIYFDFNDTCFKLQINDFIIYRQTNDRKSIPYEWLEHNATKVISRNGLIFDYLYTI